MMGSTTSIQWCHHTFNPWIGCSKVSPECKHCYAEADMDKRRGRVKWGPRGARSMTKTWSDVKRWNKQAAWARDNWSLDVPYERPRVFCASLADVFEDWPGHIVDHQGGMMCRCERCGIQAFGGDALPPHCGKCKGHAEPATMDDLRARLFALIDATPNLDWLLLTKRPENIRRMWPLQDCVRRRKNVWLGTSAGTRSTADKAVPELLQCRDLAAKLFVSCEPMLERVDFSGFFSDLPDCTFDPGVDWIIFGGESGPEARPCAVEWIESGVEQCRQARVAAFVKQLGADPMRDHEHVKLSDKKGGDPSEWPEEWRVREIPVVD